MPSTLLYWLGCTSRYVVPEVSSAMVDILRKSGIDYVILGDREVCCGYPLLLSGSVTSFTEVASKVVELVRSSGSDTILMNCPGCYRCFIEFYSRFLNSMPFRVVHST